MFGLAFSCPSQDLTHGQRFSLKPFFVFKWAGRIDRHQVAFVGVALLTGIAMASVEEQQAIAFVVTVLVDEVPKMTHHLSLSGVIVFGNGKSLCFKDCIDLVEFTRNAFNIGPLGVVVVACANQQCIAALV